MPIKLQGEVQQSALTQIKGPLFRWRRSHGYTQQDVADLTSLSEQSIRRVEHGTLSMPDELAAVMGGSADFYYEQWRATCRSLVKTNLADSLRGVLRQLSHNPVENPFKELRTEMGYDSVNSFAQLIKVNPRRITEVEAMPHGRNARPLGIEYRRALLQIGIPATTIQQWEVELQND